VWELSLEDAFVPGLLLRVLHGGFKSDPAPHWECLDLSTGRTFVATQSRWDPPWGMASLVRRRLL